MGSPGIRGRGEGIVFPGDNSSSRAESGNVGSSCPFPCSGKRSYLRPFLFGTQHGNQGHSGPRKAATGTVSRVWPVLSQGGPGHATKNVSHFQTSNVPSEIGGIPLLGVPRALWGLRAKQRAWYDTVVIGSRVRCHGQGRMWPRKRSLGIDCGGGRTSLPRQQQMEPGLAVTSSRRSSTEPLDFLGSDSYRIQTPFCSNVCSDLDNNSAGRPHRGGLADDEEGRSAVAGKRSFQLRQPRAQPNPKRKPGRGKGNPQQHADPPEDAG